MSMDDCMDLHEACGFLANASAETRELGENQDLDQKWDLPKRLD